MFMQSIVFRVFAVLFLLTLAVFGSVHPTMARSASRHANLENTCQGSTVTIAGDQNNNTLIGTSGDDVIHGFGGNDVIHGGGGNDIICGGDGDDWVYAGPGNNKVDGGDGSVDQIMYDISDSPVFVNLVSGIGKTALYVDTLSGIEKVVGSDYDDIIIGNDDANILWGRDGNDIVLGGGEADTITGGTGDDTLYGGDGDDWLVGHEGNDRSMGALGTTSFGAYLGRITSTGVMAPKTRPHLNCILVVLMWI